MSVIKLFYGNRNVGDTNQFQNTPVKKKKPIYWDRII